MCEEYFRGDIGAGTILTKCAYAYIYIYILSHMCMVL